MLGGCADDSGFITFTRTPDFLRFRHAHIDSRHHVDIGHVEDASRQSDIGIYTVFIVFAFFMLFSYSRCFRLPLITIFYISSCLHTILDMLYVDDIAARRSSRIIEIPAAAAMQNIILAAPSPRSSILCLRQKVPVEMQRIMNTYIYGYFTLRRHLRYLLKL